MTDTIIFDGDINVIGVPFTGNYSLDEGFESTSVIGCLNELLAGSGGESDPLKVPYTGATGNADLGNYNLTATKFLASAGSAAAPSWVTSTDTDTGAYSPGANRYGWAIAGVHAGGFDEYRNFVVGATIPGTARFQVLQATTGVGTVSVSGTAVTGVGTQFTNTFKVADTITVTTTSGSETKAIATITSDTVLVTAAFAGTAAAGTAYTLVGGTRFSVYGNGNIIVGALTGTAAILNLPVGTTESFGINFGGDVNLYRSSANGLRTDDSFTVGTGITIIGNSNFNSQIYIVKGTDDGIKFCLSAADGDDNNHLIITALANYSADHDHDTLSTNPTLYIHSITSPDSDNTQWGSFAHDVTNFVITAGKGAITFCPAAAEKMRITANGALIIGATVTDATLVNGVVLVNGTGPSAHYDNEVILYSADGRNQESILSIWAEGAVSGSGDRVGTTTIPVTYNGTRYWIIVTNSDPEA